MMPRLRCAKSCRELLGAASVSLKMQYRDERERAINSWRIGTACEIYLQIISGNEKPPLAILLKNLPTLLKVLFTASARIHGLTKHVLENRQLDPSGQQVGSAHKALGLLYKVKKKQALAIEHLTEAKRI